MWSDHGGGSLPGHGRVDGLEVEAERPAPAPLVHVPDVAGGVIVSGARTPGQPEASVLQKPIVGHPELRVSLGTQGLEKMIVKICRDNANKMSSPCQPPSSPS